MNDRTALVLFAVALGVVIAVASVTTLERDNTHKVSNDAMPGTTGLAGASDYCAAKGAIISFSKSVAKEVVPFGVLVNCIAPGFIQTPMTAPIPAEVKKQIEAATPIGRFGEPRDIALAALYLASDDANFMVGQVLSPNGGYVI